MRIRFESQDGLSLEIEDSGFTQQPFEVQYVYRNLGDVVDPSSGSLPRRRYGYVEMLDENTALYREVL